MRSGLTPDAVAMASANARAVVRNMDVEPMAQAAAPGEQTQAAATPTGTAAAAAAPQHATAAGRVGAAPDGPAIAPDAGAQRVPADAGAAQEATDDAATAAIAARAAAAACRAAARATLEDSDEDAVRAAANQQRADAPPGQEPPAGAGGAAAGAAAGATKRSHHAVDPLPHLQPPFRLTTARFGRPRPNPTGSKPLPPLRVRCVAPGPDHRPWDGLDPTGQLPDGTDRARVSLRLSVQQHMNACEYSTANGYDDPVTGESYGHARVTARATGRYALARPLQCRSLRAAICEPMERLGGGVTGKCRYNLCV